MTEVNGRHEIREVTVAVAQELYDTARSGLIVSPDQTLPSVAGRVPEGAVDPKWDRYVLGAVVGGLVGLHTFEDDGPDAYFLEASLEPAPSPCIEPDPYLSFERAVTNRLLHAEQRLLSSSLAPAVGILLGRYQIALAGDPSKEATRLPVELVDDGGVLNIASDSEGPSEVGMHVLQTGVLIHNAMQEGAMLQKPPKQISYDLVEPLAMARSGLPVTDFRGVVARHFVDRRSPTGEYRPLADGQEISDYDLPRLVFRASGRYSAENIQSRILPADHPWRRASERIGPTVKCLMRLIRLEPDHRFSALHNFVYASINLADERGLLDPELAAKTWGMRKAEYARLGILKPLQNTP